MKCRGFLMSAMVFLGVGKLFGKDHCLPVVKFKDGKIVNRKELLRGIHPIVMHGDSNTEYRFRTKVFVNEADAFQCGNDAFYGETELKQYLFESRSLNGKINYTGTMLLCSTTASLRKTSNCHYLTINNEETCEIINKLRKTA